MINIFTGFVVRDTSRSREPHTLVSHTVYNKNVCAFVPSFFYHYKQCSLEGILDCHTCQESDAE